MKKLPFGGKSVKPAKPMLPKAPAKGGKPKLPAKPAMPFKKGGMVKGDKYC